MLATDLSSERALESDELDALFTVVTFFAVNDDELFNSIVFLDPVAREIVPVALIVSPTSFAPSVAEIVL